MAAATQMIEMARGYQLSQALFVAAQLGIADQLAHGPMPIAALARATDTNAPALHRLLRVLASRGVLTEVGDKTFALTSFGTLLRRDIPGSARAQVLLWGHPMQWDSWSALLHSVRTGETAFEKRFGVDHWEYLERNPDAGAMFKAAMAAHPCHAEVPLIYDFSQLRTVVDVGGGKGQLLIEILQACPGTRGILLDRPEGIPDATQALAAAGVGARCEVLGGDFFNDLPTGAAAYILSNVLMDWGDAAAVRLLRQCRSAMGREGILLVVERIIESDNRPSLSQLGDLMGLVVTGGRVRAESELDLLFVAAGLRRTHSLRTASGYCILELVSG
jgi:SAM-dependent methyltransferase